MSGTDGIDYEVDDHIATITISRQERMNSLDDAAHRAMDAAFAAAEADHEVRVIVLTGAGGRAFCAGADLKAEPDESGPRVSFGAITGVSGPARHVSKPIIAAVRGHVIGGGFELAAACDIIVASAGSLFSMPEGVLGFLVESPVGHRSVRQLPFHIALEMALVGRRISAEEAAHWGFVNHVVSDDEVLPLSRRLAATIASLSPLAIAAYRDTLVSRAGWPLEVALATRNERIEQYQRSADRSEGIAAYREGREPRWTGR
ncbi:enoyl-CoA hydratase-related protein [Microbacterium sp. BWT-B31]|uniref:enoyl-CoA hydratase/isomerase family protein n=1 Tax=Microbacterium sp. BWT-B31 TaxID=3232072 RepID=UPI0035270772